VIDTHSRNNQIQSVRAWQLSTQKWTEIQAKYFIDCSGDSILRYCGAEFYRGREGMDEFNESLTVDKADNCSMGNSILLQLREVDEHVPFIPPEWAHHFSEEDLPYRMLKAQANSNFWWLEVGGMQDTIVDAESIRDELLKIAYGVWDCIKNHPDGRGHQWELEWIGSVPGKRENIRYKGDWLLTQDFNQRMKQEMNQLRQQMNQLQQSMHNQGKQNSWSQFESIQIESKGNNKHRAEIKYKDSDDNSQAFVFEGELNEIKQQIVANKEMDEVKKQQLLQALNMNNIPSFPFRPNHHRMPGWFNTPYPGQKWLPNN